MADFFESRKRIESRLDALHRVADGAEFGSTLLSVEDIVEDVCGTTQWEDNTATGGRDAVQRTSSALRRMKYTGTVSITCAGRGLLSPQ